LRCFSVGFRVRLNLLALTGLLAFPMVVAEAAGYGWGGVSSTDWSAAANWWAGSVAPTGGTYDATLYITNTSNNTLTYTAANGSTLYTSSTRCLRIGDIRNGSMAITGGFLETRCSGDFVGNSTGSGLLLIDGGTYVSTNGEFLLGANLAQGTLTVNSGSATLASMRLWGSAGTVNLNGGTFGLGGMSWQTGSAALNLNGGTLQVSRNTSSWMYSGTNWTVRLNAATTLDSQNFSATNAAPIIGTGTLTKAGSGLIALNVSNTIAAVTVNEGTLALGGSNTISSGVTLNSGTLAINHAAALGSSTFTIKGGQLQNTSGSTVINSLNGPINLYSNFTFAGTRDLNLGTGTATLYKNLAVTNTSRTLTFGGDVTNSGGDYALTVTGAGGMAIKGNLGIGGRVTVAGGCTLHLAGANSYTGATWVSAGSLIAANASALGTTNAATDVQGGSSLQLTDGIAIEKETVYLAGSGFSDNRGTLQSASGSTNTWNGPLLLNDSTQWTPRLGNKGSGVLIANGPIIPAFSGANSLFISGDPDGRVVIAGTNNTYSGTTGIIRGVLALGANNALPVVTALDLRPASSVTEYSKFDLNGFSQTVSALRGSGSLAPLYVTNGAETASVLTLNQTATTTYEGRIDGTVSLVKNGAGSLTLAGTNNAYAGSTTLNSGTLALGCDGALSPNTSLIISNGTLSAGSWLTTLKQLTVTGAATIDLGAGSCRLAFADSSAQAWTGTLNLTGAFNSSAVRFGTSGSGGLTQAQLSLIRINGLPQWLALNANGYLYVRAGTIIGIW
jgi:autotransporter-associated beta strand protein